MFPQTGKVTLGVCSKGNCDEASAMWEPGSPQTGKERKPAGARRKNPPAQAKEHQSEGTAKSLPGTAAVLGREAHRVPHALSSLHLETQWGVEGALEGESGGQDVSLPVQWVRLW